MNRNWANFLIAVALMSRVVVAAEQLETADQLHQMFDDKKFSELIPKLNKVLNLKGDQAKTYDRFDMLKLKGETHLNLKANGPAADAFRDAVKATESADDAAVARATELLVRGSQGTNYQPKTGGEKGKLPAPIDILEQESRKKAFEALYADMQPKAQAKIKTAATSKALQPIFEVSQTIGDLRAVEFAATGAQEQTKKNAADVGSHAVELMRDAIKTMSERVEAISVSANSAVLMSVGNRVGDTVTGVVRTGLQGHQPDELKEIEKNAQKIGAAAHDLSVAFGESGEDLQKVSDEATTLKDHAHDVLMVDYKTMRGAN